MEIIGWICKSSVMRKTRGERSVEQAIMFPQEFFSAEVDLAQILSLNGSYDNADWMKKVQEKINSCKDEKDLEAYLGSYFDAVIQKFESDTK